MGDFSALASCAELSAEQAEEAARSPTDLKALLVRWAEIARPEDGCPKVLMAVARAATQPWLEADLRVELAGDDASTTLSVVYDHGFGIRERVFPAVQLGAPIDEFQRAIKLAPKLVAPLHVEEDDGGRLVLTQRTRVTSAPPPPIKIDETSMTDVDTTPAQAESGTAVRSESVVVRVDAQAEDEDVVPADIDMREPLAVNGPTPFAPGANPHTRPTRKMSTIDPEILRAAMAKSDPRRDED